MPAEFADSSLGLERLSALVDGELDEASVRQACAQWRDEPIARSTWHRYHLIGDLLRSEDLGATPARDAAFLQALRARMEQEPVVFAPASVSPASPSLPGLGAEVDGVPQRANAGRRGRWGWMAPGAVAAGFVVVAGALMMTRDPGGAPTPAFADASTWQPVAAADAPDVASLVPVGSSEIAGPFFEPQQVATGGGRLLRDAGLDRYLAAHKQFAGSTALGVPSAFLRRATADVPAR